MPLTPPNWTYTQWLSWLEERSPMPEVGPSLQPIQQALNESGLLKKINPNKIIHIAGTNGKGTTAKTLQKLLSDQNLRVGLYTSPHLVDTCERIRINETLIPQNTLVECLKKYYPLILKYNLSHFESLTLISVAHFFEHSPVDWAIFEIGLGGTWDATNAIPHSTSIITALGFDHQHILGHTLKEIAANKFGIIQANNNVSAWSYEDNQANTLLKDICKKQNAKLQIVHPPDFSLETSNVIPSTLLKTPWGEAKLSLPGSRAAQNMWMALNVFQQLGFAPQRGLKTLESIHWPARMTRFEKPTLCPVYLSGDHNLQGIDSLLDILKFAKYKTLHFILGLSKNRSHTEFLEKLKAVPRASITLTCPNFRGVEPESKEFPFYKDPIIALQETLKYCAHDDLIVITGSLYLCGDILRGQDRVS